MSNFGTIPPQAACINCSCGYFQTQEMNDRVQKTRKLSDDLKKSSTTMTIHALKTRLEEIGINIDIGGCVPTLRGNLGDFCELAKGRALKIIENNRFYLISLEAAVVSESDGC